MPNIPPEHISQMLPALWERYEDSNVAEGIYAGTAELSFGI